MNEERKSRRPALDKIAERNNWLKIFVVATAAMVISAKIWTADFNQALEGFKFSDLLALFLAMFSIALSVLFYLKATETSNVFYDNTYRFTKDVAEILGRVEAGFGEKLAHLDEGYTGLRTAVENIPFDRLQAERDIEEEEQEVQRVEHERDQLIEGILKRARLDSEDKENLRTQLHEKEEELTRARQELAFTRRQMQLAEEQLDGRRVRPRIDSNILRVPSSVRKSFQRATSAIPDELIENASLSALNELWQSTVENRRVPVFWKRLGMVDEDGNITRSGREILRSQRNLEDA